MAERILEGQYASRWEFTAATWEIFRIRWENLGSGLSDIECRRCLSVADRAIRRHDFHELLALPPPGGQAAVLPAIDRRKRRNQTVRSCILKGEV